MGQPRKGGPARGVAPFRRASITPVWVNLAPLNRRGTRTSGEGVAEAVPVVEWGGVTAAAAEVAVGFTRSPSFTACGGLDHDLEQFEQFAEAA